MTFVQFCGFLHEYLPYIVSGCEFVALMCFLKKRSKVCFWIWLISQSTSLIWSLASGDFAFLPADGINIGLIIANRPRPGKSQQVSE